MFLRVHEITQGRCKNEIELLKNNLYLDRPSFVKQEWQNGRDIRAHFKLALERQMGYSGGETDFWQIRTEVHL